MNIVSFHDLNYWAILVAAVINMAVGAFWYSPAVFGKVWAKALGKKTGDMGDANTGYSIMTLSALVQNFILANLVFDLGLTTVSKGAMLGFWIWLGFMALVMGGDVVFSGRSWNIWKINAGYYFVILLINGALLAAWR
jgi:hypothetical protein